MGVAEIAAIASPFAVLGSGLRGGRQRGSGHPSRGQSDCANRTGDVMSGVTHESGIPSWLAFSTGLLGRRGSFDGRRNSSVDYSSKQRVAARGRALDAFKSNRLGSLWVRFVVFGGRELALSEFRTRHTGREPRISRELLHLGNSGEQTCRFERYTLGKQRFETTKNVRFTEGS